MAAWARPWPSRGRWADRSAVTAPTAPELYDTPPQGGEAVWLRTADDITLRAAFWRAEGSGRGTVLLATGRSEFIEKYYRVIARFRALGFDVAAFDWRGQGLSDRLIEDRLHGYVDSFDSYQRDIDTLIAELGRRGWGEKLILVGHSMGGCALIRRLAQPQRDCHAAILTAPMLGLRFPTLVTPALRALSWGLARGATGKWRISPGEVKTAADWPFENNVLTSDREEFERYAALVRNNPILGLGGATWSWLAAAFRDIRALRGLPDDAVSEPTLLFSAGADQLVSNEAIDAFVARNRAVTHIRIPGSRHEPFMETEAVRAILWEEIERFLDRMVPVSIG